MTPAQAARLERMREATERLAREGGYGAVTIRAVAERAGVGLATVYRYFSSKDHLIADVHTKKSQRVIDSLRSHPPSGGSVADRVAAVFRRMLAETAADLQLASAAISAVTSGDAVAGSAEYWHEMVMSSYMDIALGDADVGNRQALGEVLGHIFFSLIIGMTTRRKTLREAQSVMDRAIHLVLPTP